MLLTSKHPIIIPKILTNFQKHNRGGVFVVSLLTFQKSYLTCDFYRLITESIETSTVGVLCRKVLLKISQNSHENTCVVVSFLIKLQACNFIKSETPTKVFSSEFWEFFKNSYFVEHLRTAAFAARYSDNNALRQSANNFYNSSAYIQLFSFLWTINDLQNKVIRSSHLRFS